MSAPLVQVRPLYEGPEVPEDVLRRLRELSPQLGLRFYQGQGWKIMWKWREDDRRRAYIQRGELPADEDNDIVADLPDDLPPDQIAGYLEFRLKQHPASHLRELCDSLLAQREKVTDAAAQAVVDEAMNAVEVNPSNLFAGIGKTMFKGFQAGFGKGPRTEVNRDPAPNA